MKQIDESQKIKFEFSDLGDDIMRMRFDKDTLVITANETRKFNIMKDRVLVSTALAKELDNAVEKVIADLANGEDDLAGFSLK